MDASKLLTEGNARRRRNSATAPRTPGGASSIRQRCVTVTSRQSRNNNVAPGHTCSRPHLDTPRPMGKPLAAAHEQLELLLTRIERGSDDTSQLGQRRRGNKPPARAVRRQMALPPPVPNATPLSSARYKQKELQPSECSQQQQQEQQQQQQQVVPLAHNPQLLLPAQRRALLELLSHTEQPHDQHIVHMLTTGHGHGDVDVDVDANGDVAGDPSRNAMRLTLQMLPLALKPGNSPYCKRFWAGHRYLKERQKLHQQLEPNDMRYKEVKILRSSKGKFFLSQTLEEELKDEKQVLDFIDSQLYQSQQKALTPEQRERQQQALDERAELDRQKQQVSEWRRRHQQHELKRAKIEANKLLAKQMREKPVQRQLQVIPEEVHMDGEETPRPSAGQLAMPEELKQLYLQRQQFQQQCQQSNLYNNPNCAAPWKLFANIASNLSAQLTSQADDELHRSIANYLKDFVATEARFGNQSEG
ncbi:putative mediator of RNA polymerase II transcription subunit 26 [Drosophila nasuta]|uniref:putative mediator of RNA polymerase II transcription subunit 26 n=1 Tax=Drosophila nasuta TaxID=42062 RepID=UPI00295ECC6F|nr:putative mediator of RNA polymerase II transcription subunit 26 [Drosophila nasuta]